MRSHRLCHPTNTKTQLKPSRCIFKAPLISCHILFVMGSVNHLDSGNNVFSQSKSLNTDVVISHASSAAWLERRFNTVLSVLYECAFCVHVSQFTEEYKYSRNIRTLPPFGKLFLFSALFLFRGHEDIFIYFFNLRQYDATVPSCCSSDQLHFLKPPLFSSCPPDSNFPSTQLVSYPLFFTYCPCLWRISPKFHHV